MSFSNAMKDSLYLHYSPSFRYSVGIEALADKLSSQDETLARLTYLAYRKNTRFSQANIYLSAGTSLNQEKVNFVSLDIDWETRRWLIAAGYTDKSSRPSTSELEARITDTYLKVGVAPYLGDYGDFHTWLVIKASRDSLNDKWATYPVLKFFKGSFLMEIGHDDSELDAHFMYRF